MMGDKNTFVPLKAKEGGYVTYVDDSKGKILGIGSIRHSLTTFIENVLLVNVFKHNLLSISQLCGKGYKIDFNKDCCTISIQSLIKLNHTSLGIVRAGQTLKLVVGKFECYVTESK